MAAKPQERTISKLSFDEFQNRLDHFRDPSTDWDRSCSRGYILSCLEDDVFQNPHTRASLQDEEVEPDEPCTRLLFFEFQARVPEDLITTNIALQQYLIDEYTWTHVRMYVAIPFTDATEQSAVLLDTNIVTIGPDLSLSNIYKITGERRVSVVLSLPVTAQEYASVVLSMRQPLGRPFSIFGLYRSVYGNYFREMDGKTWFASEWIHSVMLKSGIYQRFADGGELTSTAALQKNPGQVGFSELFGFLDAITHRHEQLDTHSTSEVTISELTGDAFFDRLNRHLDSCLYWNCADECDYIFSCIEEDMIQQQSLRCEEFATNLCEEVVGEEPCSHLLFFKFYSHGEQPRVNMIQQYLYTWRRVRMFIAMPFTDATDQNAVLLDDEWYAGVSRLQYSTILELTEERHKGVILSLPVTAHEYALVMLSMSRETRIMTSFDRMEAKNRLPSDRIRSALEMSGVFDRFANGGELTSKEALEWPFKKHLGFSGLFRFLDAIAYRHELTDVGAGAVVVQSDTNTDTNTPFDEVEYSKS